MKPWLTPEQKDSLLTRQENLSTAVRTLKEIQTLLRQPFDTDSSALLDDLISDLQAERNRIEDILGGIPPDV